MSVKDSGLLYEEVYKGLGDNGIESDSLPPQALPLSKKGDKWGKDTMDRLEEIGIRQLNKSFVFNDLYAMIEGDLTFLEYGEVPDILQHVDSVTESLNLPHYIENFDIIGKLGNFLASIYNSTKSKYRIDFLDKFGEAEYDRELNNRLFDYIKKAFSLEVQKQMVLHGIDTNRRFKDPKEQAQYIQAIKQKMSELDLPHEIKSAVDVDWKPEIVEYVQSIIDRDNRDYRTEQKDYQRMIDKYLTGRYFNHYKIGYDYYDIERWHPAETFFSEDADVRYPQYCEYVGNIQDMAPSKVVDSFGHLMKRSDQKLILNHFDYQSSEGVLDTWKDSVTVEGEVIPDRNYYDRMSSKALQDTFGVPLGELQYTDKEGNLQKRPDWIPDYRTDLTGGITNRSAKLRRDISGRTDTIRVVQAYWRSWDEVIYLYYETELGFPVFEMLTSDLIGDFIKDNKIKNLKSLSIDKFMDKLDAGTIEPGSMVITYKPVIYKGVKLSENGGILDKSIYLDVGKLPFQIKGKSNMFNVQIPVTGIISTSEAKKMLPYQKEYNYQMNLIRSLTEKEIGIFWMFDIALLPSDFKEMGGAEEILSNVVEMARDIGLVPMDTSRQNLQDRNPQAPGMMPQNISFVPEIQNKIQLANYYKNLALDQIGLGAEDMGSHGQYATAEGIRTSQQNAMSNIEHIFYDMDDARMKDIEVNIAVHQYAQSNGKDNSVSFITSDEGRIVRKMLNQFQDYPYRRFGLVPMDDRRSVNELQKFKQFIYSSNTFSDDLIDYAKVITSDSFQEVKKVLSKAQRERLQQRSQEQQFQMQMQKSKESGLSELEKEKFKEEIIKLRLKIQGDENVARIKEGRNTKDDYSTFFNNLLEKNKFQHNKQKDERDSQISNRKLDIQQQKNEDEKDRHEKLRDLKERELEEKKRQNDIREKENNTKRFTSVINKN